MESSGLKFALLGKNSSEIVLKLDPDRAKFPLLLSFNFMVTKPHVTEEEEADPIVEEVQ